MLELIPDWPSGNYYKCEVTAKAIEENHFKLCISTTSVFPLTGPNSSLVFPTPQGLLSFMYVCLCNCPCVCTHSPMDVGRASLELVLQAVVSSPVWVLEMNSGPVEKQYMLLNYWAMSPVLVFLLTLPSTCGSDWNTWFPSVENGQQSSWAGASYMT